MQPSHAVQSPAKPLRAVKIIRVSKQGKRSAERFVSPEDQHKMINGLALQQNWVFVSEFTEMNQSGYRTKLPKRKGLYPAMLMVESGDADVVVFGYRDRMARNNLVEDEFLGRVGKAGGQVWAADMGQIKTDTAVERLTSGLLGLVQQYVAESTRDKTAGPTARAVAAGIPPFPTIPPGYRKGKDRSLVVDEREAALVRRAFELRAEGMPLIEVRDWLRSQGIDRGYRGTQEMLKSRLYLGELRFGKLENLHAHEPIIDPVLFRSVQNMRVSRERREKSVRLLARQNLVICSVCNGRMVVGGQNRRNARGETVRYDDYRCNPTGNCPRRQSISAAVLEAEVIKWVEQGKLRGRATTEQQMNQLDADVEATEKAFAAGIQLYAGMDDMPAAREKLLALRERHQSAVERRDAAQLVFGPSGERIHYRRWKNMKLNEQRVFLRVLIKRIVIRPGDGAARIGIEQFGE